MKFNTTIIVVIAVSICGSLFLIAAVVCGGFLMVGLSTVDTAVAPEVDKFFRAIETETCGDFYDTHTTPEFRDSMSREAFEQTGATIKTHLGRLQSKTRIQLNVNQVNANTLADVSYTGIFEKGKGMIQVRLQKPRGEWRLVSFAVSSPEFTKILATEPCPHCGKPRAASDAFCPHCGKPKNESHQNDS